MRNYSLLIEVHQVIIDVNKSLNECTIVSSMFSSVDKPGHPKQHRVAILGRAFFP